jgi:hypothetical protein
MYEIKNLLRRASSFAGAVSFIAVLCVSLVPPGTISADALNPLTQRSLTLSSSSPGWSYTDGSGDPWDISCYTSTCAPGYSPYASPNSGANGQKTGESFSYRVSTDSSAGGAHTVNGISLQYCTTSAGNCTAPGDDAVVSGTPDTRGPDTSSTSDLNVSLSTPTEVSSGNIATYVDLTTGNVIKTVPPTDSAGSFAVLTKDVGGSWALSTGWAETTTNLENGSPATDNGTGKNNFIQLINSGGGMALHSTGEVKIVFFGTNDNYITNPGSDAFFVKINDYDNAVVSGTSNSSTMAIPTNTTDLVDGGVTVANVMNQSIQIETKVLETMDFSVGTVDPDTLDSSALHTATGDSGATHGICDPILTTLDPTNPTDDPSNFLYLGDPNAENSLSTTHTYGTYSYFRLSSNSTGGATVYYAGSTLSDTEGDQISPMGWSSGTPTVAPTATAPQLGSPQFGLALDNDTNAADTATYDSTGTTESVNFGYNNHTYNSVPFDYETGADGLPTGVDAGFTSAINGNASAHDPQLYPLAPLAQYADGTGVYDKTGDGTPTSGPDNGVADPWPTSTDTQFAFDGNANNVAAPLATESTAVVNCITGKVRYIANIAATTPAGIFTTKINYIASPQY